jgi:hypothetical protein
LSRIVTGDEMCAHHYEPKSKNQSMAWKHPGSPMKKEFKTRSSAGKVMLTIFWDSKGPILEDYRKSGSSLMHTASRAAMFTLSQQHGNWCDQGQTSIMWPQ